MSNTRAINPLNIWTKNGNTEANYLALTNFYGYNFDNGSGKATYKLLFIDEKNGTTDLYSSEIDIPSEIIIQWGENDNVIFNYVASILKVEFI